MKSRREFLKYGTMAAAASCAPFGISACSNNRLNGKGDKDTFLKACSTGNVNEVTSLLAKNPTLLIAKDKHGRSGFALALLNGHKDIADQLKKAGYEADLHESVLHLDWERYESLIGEETEKTIAQINREHPIGGTVMWAAAAGGAGADMWRVYAKCGDPNYGNQQNSGITPLQKALRFPDLDRAELTAAALLSNQTNPNPVLNDDLPPLHIAAERGSYEMVEMLLRLGADFTTKDRNGKTAAQLAEAADHQKVWALLQNQAAIPRTCRTSRTAYQADGQKYQATDISDIPLYLRRKFVGQAHGNIDYIKEHIGKDARLVHSVATTSEICVEACAHIGRKNIVEFLLKNGAPYSLPTAVLLNDFTTVKKYLAEDPNRIHERGAHDFGLLWYPVIGRCDLEMTQLLLDKGAKVEEQHFLGTTALHWACFRGPVELVALLIENGADVNRVSRKFNAAGERPLQMAKDEAVIKLLKSKGAV